MKKDLTESQQGAIIYEYQKDNLLRTIVAIAGCSKSFVENIIKQYSELSTEIKKKDQSTKNSNTFGF